MARNNGSMYLLIFFVIFAFCLSHKGVYAFGAGNIPSFAYIEGRAFRHGDIEDVLAELVKRTGGFALGNLIGKGSKFGGLDIKRVYFGNWLRDYSQAVDIAALKKLQLQTIINLCMVLGFLAHGYATHEFEVTPERLGCYLPTEHIDNPKGYGDGEDARKYNPGLRGPVDPRELEIDHRTGMKNYIANESGTWDTSKTLVRRTLERCIHLGRQHRQSGKKEDEYEAFRLLGTALHTLEDFSAHSNFCELALVSMGYSQVFVQVGDQVRIQAPGGHWVAPLVTGTFGSSDFIHSLLGEAGDKLSSASVTDLSREFDKARSRSATQTRGPGGPVMSPADALRDILFTLPGGTGNEMNRDLQNIERIRAGPAAGGKNPEEMSPQELHSILWQVLTFRDSIVKKIEKTIEKIPGLGPLIAKLMDAIFIFVFTTLEPFVKPLLKSATSGLQSASGEVIDSHDQYEVFNDPRASDPTHSFLSKDHFNLILNEPAGRIAKVIVINSVKLITKAWENVSVPVHQLTEEILQCLFHPDFHDTNSKVQREMLQALRDWFQKVPNQGSVLQRLSKNAVRNHENIRVAGEGGPPASHGSAAEGQGHQFQQSLSQNVPLFGTALNFATGNSRDSATTVGYVEASSHSVAVVAPGPFSNTDQTSSYYRDTQPGNYAPPPGPPPPTWSYSPPDGPPSFQPPSHLGYAPSYGPASYDSSSPAGVPLFPSEHSPPSFPGAGGYGFPSPPDRPLFPVAPGGYAPPSEPSPSSYPQGGYAPPPGPPTSFPPAGGYIPPSGPPPGQGGPPQQSGYPGQAYHQQYGHGW